MYCYNVSRIALWASHMYSHRGIQRLRNAFIIIYQNTANTFWLNVMISVCSTYSIKSNNNKCCFFECMFSHIFQNWWWPILSLTCLLLQKLWGELCNSNSLCLKLTSFLLFWMTSAYFEGHRGDLKKEEREKLKSCFHVV